MASIKCSGRVLVFFNCNLLCACGVGFNPDSSQDKDLTPMVGEENNENIEISEVKHKVAFDLDEKGIEGAATTVHQISFR